MEKRQSNGMVLYRDQVLNADNLDSLFGKFRKLCEMWIGN
jgi:hypothetical protein